MGSADLWLDFGIASATCFGCLYITVNMLMWAWWLRTSDVLLRYFFWGVIFIMLGVAQWAGTNAYLIWIGLNDPPATTLWARVFILVGVLWQATLTIGVFQQRKYNRGRFSGTDRRSPFQPPI